MRKNNFGGLFIAFEGLDGSGLSTQVNLLSAKLQSKGYPNLATKEPTNNLIGGLIRGQLTHDWQASMECLQLLFTADRAHHLDREIIPALKAGKIVISDRYFFSSVAFGSLELDKDWLILLNEKIIYPDITILIRVSPEECLTRIGQNRFRFELFEKRKKLKKVWLNYLWLRKKFSNVYLIDGNRSKEAIASEVLEIVKQNILHKKKILV